MSEGWDWEFTDIADRLFEAFDEYAQDRISCELPHPARPDGLAEGGGLAPAPQLNWMRSSRISGAARWIISNRLRERHTRNLDRVFEISDCITS